jgi:hypothetical protein
MILHKQHTSPRAAPSQFYMNTQCVFISTHTDESIQRNNLPSTSMPRVKTHPCHTPTQIICMQIADP